MSGEQTPPPGPPRRKVAWGTPAVDTDAAPVRRRGTVPDPVFATPDVPTFAPVPAATSNPFAQLRAGTASAAELSGPEAVWTAPADVPAHESDASPELDDLFDETNKASHDDAQSDPAERTDSAQNDTQPADDDINAAVKPSDTDVHSDASNENFTELGSTVETLLAQFDHAPQVAPPGAEYSLDQATGESSEDATASSLREPALSLTATSSSQDVAGISVEDASSMAASPDPETDGDADEHVLNDKTTTTTADSDLEDTVPEQGLVERAHPELTTNKDEPMPADDTVPVPDHAPDTMQDDYADTKIGFGDSESMPMFGTADDGETPQARGHEDAFIQLPHNGSSSVLDDDTTSAAEATDVEAEPAPAELDSVPSDGDEADGDSSWDLEDLFDDEDDSAAVTEAVSESEPDLEPEIFSGDEASVVLPADHVENIVPLRPQMNLAARRAAIEAARIITTKPEPVQSTADSVRYSTDPRHVGLVDQILGLAQSGNPQLQGMIRRMQLTRDVAQDRNQRATYQRMMEPLLASKHIQISDRRERDLVFDMAYDELIGIGPLGQLWRDPSVSEIMVSGPNKVTIECNGALELTNIRFRDLDHLSSTARNLAAISADDRSLSATSPLPTIQLPRARVQFAWRPIAVSGVSLTIRKFGDLMDMSQLLSYGSLSEEMGSLLCDLVAARATVVVSGGTGSGKTTFINALSEFIPDSERVITIEDALELQLRNTHVESLITKESASADDTVHFGQEALLKASLRMRPDRIIVGEIRDGKGCSVMLEAANTGHDGTMTTIHADGPDEALHRMQMLLRRAEAMSDDLARIEVNSAIDVVVQVVRRRGRRFVSDISLVTKPGESNPESVTRVFSGEFPAGADAPVFRRVGGIGPDTEISLKMTDAGIDPSVWK